LHHNTRSIKVSEIPCVSGGVDKHLDYCINNLRKIGYDAIVVDVTTPDIGCYGLTVVRVIIPGFQPMHFGYNECRLGANRLFTLPKKIGFSDHNLTVDELNTFPHPLG
jgi:ribosomal protein S12 methylthiotransferase accessory factor